MPYCTIDQMRRLLPKTITIGDNTLADSDVIQKQGKANTVPTKTAMLYINLGDQFIDGRLRPVYVCPLSKTKIAETTLADNVAQGADTFNLVDASRFEVGGVVRLSDATGSDTHQVEHIGDKDGVGNQIKISPATRRPYASSGTTASYIDYPAPISSMATRFAVSMCIDKQVVADQEPNVSTYGKTQRTLATNDMDAILSGAIRLEGQIHTGRRFARTSLRDTHSSTATLQPGQGKEA